ncbi:lytic murein transglycosylase [Ursidibacter maritimus]|uniref:Lytic murein transglycosylase n=1 Tax=Ursidibacter maritimus TaxID=1331689 RepID=A0A949WGC4_9PAST|nr:lytic murein transglycosylase [Ursidibacter maritimus]KAE9539209.1 lytic transglycosylase [Ursidibacter maritimus]MBV6523966.1 lytic murein transglycosylase [Ursidibacter maritimus]MBV6525463.1 lytic murein transglycosylase [Ursidibacter maritimus]MBV6526933.1 lytic murein transglycosylase [Ursidibacter maritimus]MBV6530208.1 lytic murein transglycosylase [Ursidibacter maritimus]
MSSTLRLLSVVGLTCLILTSCSSEKQYDKLALDANYTKSRTFTNFNDYVVFLKKKAAAAGVTEKTLNSQMGINYIARAVELDQQQAARRRDPNLPPPPPNPNGVTNYLNKVLTQAKVNIAVDRWWKYQQQLEKASQKYGVQKEYLMALWGMESSFGRYQGNFDVLSVLATLAFDGRREKLFTQEFVNAMKMLDSDTISRNEMKGSWAGAMGQTQFMPTSYLKYAADGNNDGKKDIWKNEYDAFASIATYLSTVGWDKNLPWGVEVKLAQPIDMVFAGIEDNKAKSLAEWQTLGIYLAYPNGQEVEKLAKLNNTKLWLVRPDKEVGRAFLVSNNFRTILDWNKSNNFAVSIGKFADRILLGVQ